MQNNDIADIIYHFSKYAQAADSLADWEALLEEVNTPIPKQMFGRAISYVVKGVTGLTEVGGELKDVPKEDVEMALQVGAHIGAVKNSSIDLDKIKKFSKDFQELNKTAQMSILKELGSGALKVVPIIGVVFSAALAVKNLVYGFMEFITLMDVSRKVGLAPYETLFADPIIKKIAEFSSQPAKLTDLVKTCKSAKVFVDEAISFGANSIDFIKDLIFLIIEAIVATGSFIIPPGWAATLGVASIDIALSFIIMVFEYYIEEAAKKKYTDAITSMGELADTNIKRLSVTTETSEEPVTTNYDEMDLEELMSLYA